MDSRLIINEAWCLGVREARRRVPELPTNPNDPAYATARSHFEQEASPMVVHDPLFLSEGARIATSYVLTDFAARGARALRRAA